VTKGAVHTHTTTACERDVQCPCGSGVSQVGVVSLAVVAAVVLRAATVVVVVLDTPTFVSQVHMHSTL
jgi:hypothetical protein